jgi:hypothetical protein
MYNLKLIDNLKKDQVLYCCRRGQINITRVTADMWDDSYYREALYGITAMQSDLQTVDHEEALDYTINNIDSRPDTVEMLRTLEIDVAQLKEYLRVNWKPVQLNLEKRRLTRKWVNELLDACVDRPRECESDE